MSSEYQKKIIISPYVELLELTNKSSALIDIKNYIDKKNTLIIFINTKFNVIAAYGNIYTQPEIIHLKS